MASGASPPHRSPELVDPALLLELTRRYTEPHRHYHGLMHVASMLETGRELDLDDDQVLAIWFHDAVYEIPGPDNEEASAQLAIERLTAAGLAEERVDRIATIIRDTRTHVPTCEGSKAVIDLDLASLALPRPAFERNGAKIRAEWSHVDDAAFAAGRLGFMEEFLARERLYWTDWGAPMEARARENLELDVALLREQLGR